MKKVVLALALMLMVMTGRSQSFEGIMRWNMKMEITDPTAKAEMEEAKKKANDPANQAQIKELQAKMNDPQFKSMLESNPQMKAQLEATLKMMAGGDLSAMLPSGVVVKLKGTNSLISLEGGMMDKNDVLYVADKDATYTINHNAKSYMQMPKKSTTPHEKPKVTKTSETTKILNYTCTKYIIETTTPDGKTMKTNYWATNEIKDIDIKTLAKQQMGKDQSFVYSEVDGVPMKVEVTMPGQGKLTMEMTEFKKISLPASDFALPAGYSETKM
jgi:hypothetical protein